jgi:hypothetical protein
MSAASEFGVALIDAMLNATDFTGGAKHARNGDSITTVRAMIANLFHWLESTDVGVIDAETIASEAIEDFRIERDGRTSSFADDDWFVEMTEMIRSTGRLWP